MTEVLNQISVEDIDGGITLVKFLHAKYIDDREIQKLKEELLSLVRDKGKKKILLSWENVTFFSSVGLGALLVLDKLVKKAGGKLVFCSVVKDVNDVLVITKLNKILDVQDNLVAGISVLS